MSLKMKLTSVIIAIALVFSMLIIGVLSVKNVNFKLGGKITFNAEGLELTISDGQLNNTDAYTGTTALSEKMKGLKIDTSTKKETITSTLNTWNGMDLQFVENGEGGYKTNSITFSISNDSAEYDLAVDITVTAEGTNTDNVKIIPIGMNTVHRSDVENYEVRFELLDSELSTDITSYEVTFNFNKYDEFEPLMLTPSGTSQANEDGINYMEFTTTDVETTAMVEGIEVAGTAELKKYFGTESSVRVPAYVERNGKVYEVRSIKGNPYPNSSEAFVQNKNIKNITLPLTLTEIGGFAFCGCSSLTTIDLPSSVNTIGRQAFSSCSGLTSIVVPTSVQTIGENTFSSCSNLTIYCEATEKPVGWDSNWNSDNRPVVWGYTENV